MVTGKKRTADRYAKGKAFYWSLDDLLKDLSDKSCHLVLGAFSKKKQREILEHLQKGK